MDKLEAIISQYKSALSKLKEVLDMPYSEVIRDSAIQRFEFTLDLSWKSLKAYLEKNHGIICRSPKDCFRQAYQVGIIDYDNYWIKLVDLRNLTSHTYKEEFAIEVFNELHKAKESFELLLTKIESK